VSELDEACIRVHSSDGDDMYLVSFRRRGTRLSLSCTCGSGKYGKLCKHKLGLISGENFPSVFDDDLHQLDIISKMVEGSILLSRLAEYRIAKSRAEEAKTELELSKARLERAMRDDEFLDP
jgi:hypothetical protein